MSNKTTQQVAIVGGGSAAWWLARELAQKSISTIIIDQTPTASFSSTRNQGWLQSGALYALNDDSQTVAECAEGYRFLRDFAPEFINDKVPCLFLFDDREQRDVNIEKCQSYGVSAKSVSSSDLVNRESILGGSALTFAMEVEDRPVNTHGLLTKLTEQVTQAGVQFQPVSDLASIRIDQTSEGWEVQLDEDNTITSHAVVLATGALIPKLLTPFQPKAASQLSIERVGVMVLHKKVASSMLITPQVEGGPNLVPFGWPEITGASVCLAKLDRHAVDERDFRLDIDVPNDHHTMHMISLGTSYPGLAEHRINESGLPVHFYACQKLKRKVESGERHSRGSIIDLYPGTSAEFPLAVFYAGKFTSAPTSAKYCADRLAEYLGSSIPTSGQSNAPKVARQPYFDRPTDYIQGSGLLTL